jgi:Histidine kinase-, DNA gyrase B-, and HSP90-like ATPase
VRRHEVIPSARRLMHSLRDMGYDLPSAVADLIDNSIDAAATRIRIDVGADWRGSYVRIEDDGHGMTERQLDEAMRYGSHRSYDERDLGHFGLGLKTASLSQCRRLTIATKSTPRGRIRIRRWDLDHVSEMDSWMLERPRALDCRPQLTEPLHGNAGTVVLWEELDRILGSRRPEGDAAERKLHLVTEDLRLHLGMVFHRFLSGESRKRRLRITLNGERVSAWDPFARHEKLTQALPVQRLPFAHDGRRFKARVRPFVLPAQYHFSTPDAHERAGGPNRWNRQQGLYIYRRDRLIQSGGWNRLRTMDEHSKLARVAVDIPAGADEAFRTNVAKMSVGLPDDLRPQLRVLIAGVVSQAQDVYRQRVRLVPDAEEQTPAGLASPFALADHWPMIVDVLEREMADHTELLDRVLVALVNARPGASGGRADEQAMIS